MSTAKSQAGHLRRLLLDGRNSDGGWGYYRGKQSRLEPTAWALMALRPAASQWGVLRRWPTVRGFLAERVGGDPNYSFHAIGVLALMSGRIDHERGTSSLCAELQQVKGVRVEPSKTSRQDNSLQAWPWIEGTFSWVEPTAWSLLAVKKAGRGGSAVDAARRDEAERLLVDRCCKSGGWNYGNGNMMGKELKPYVSTTAAALLSLQDRGSLPEVLRSREYLARQGASEHAAVSLSLAMVALSLSAAATDRVRGALDEQLAITEQLGNQFGLALALFALDTDDGYAAVRL